MSASPAQPDKAHRPRVDPSGATASTYAVGIFLESMARVTGCDTNSNLRAIPFHDAKVFETERLSLLLRTCGSEFGMNSTTRRVNGTPAFAKTAPLCS